jgi:hypothetical protein
MASDITREDYSLMRNFIVQVGGNGSGSLFYEIFSMATTGDKSKLRPAYRIPTTTIY